MRKQSSKLTKIRHAASVTTATSTVGENSTQMFMIFNTTKLRAEDRSLLMRGENEFTEIMKITDQMADQERDNTINLSVQEEIIGGDEDTEQVMEESQYPDQWRVATDGSAKKLKLGAGAILVHMYTDEEIRLKTKVPARPEEADSYGAELAAVLMALRHIRRHSHVDLTMDNESAADLVRSIVEVNTLSAAFTQSTPCRTILMEIQDILSGWTKDRITITRIDSNREHEETTDPTLHWRRQLLAQADELAEQGRKEEHILQLPQHVGKSWTYTLHDETGNLVDTDIASAIAKRWNIIYLAQWGNNRKYSTLN